MASSLTDENKNIVTLKVYLKNGRDPIISDIQNFTFNDVAFPDGTQYKNLTFSQLQNTVFTYESKHNASLTYENKN